MEWPQSGEDHRLLYANQVRVTDDFDRLVATLGSRPTTRKVSKKEILGVNVSKACGVIIDPPGPLALRLQSNLL